MSTEYEDIGDYVQSKTERQLQSQKKNILRKCVEEGHKAIARDDYESLYIILEQGLKPLCPLDINTKRRYYREAEKRELEFDWSNFTLFDNNPEEYDPRRSKYTHKNQSVLEGAFRSYESTCAIEGIVDVGADMKIPVTEFGYPIGQRRVSATSYIKGEQKFLTEENYPKISLIAGGPGSGKSTFLETLALVRYYQGDKVFDLYDTVQGENLLYDIPSDQDELRNIRSDLGLDTEFEKQPELQILVPLSKGLDDAQATVKDGEPRFTPFTIPASEIPKSALTMLVDTTQAQRKYLADAYEMMSGDWTLEDLSKAVSKTGARSDVVNRIQTSLEELQNKGYIRDKEDEHRLDWEEIMQDTGTITSLTTMFMENREESIVLSVYIMDKIKEVRKEIKRKYRNKEDLPTMTMAVREIHNIAPSESERDTDRLGDVQKFSSKKMKQISSYHRNLHMRVLGDAQLLGQQVDSGVVSMAHRIFQFQSQYASVKKSFDSRVRVHSDIIEKVANYDQGTCALLDSNGYTMPVLAAPPENRHFDSHIDLNGWSVRASLVEGEEFDSVSLDTTLPERLEFTDEDEDEDEKQTPAEKFAKRCLTHEKESFVFTPDLWMAFKTWATTNGEGMDVKKNRLMETIREVYDLTDDDKSRRNYTGRHSEKDRAFGYWGLDWTEFGEGYHDE